MKRSIMAVLVAALLVVAPLEGPLQARAAEDCRQDLGDRQPVLLVHGFDSKPADWTAGADRGRTSMVDTIASDSALVVDTFDYEAVHHQWVTDPAIGRALADRITCLADRSQKTGGPGKVIVVAHSMGGLAARQAAHHLGADVMEKLGLVITIGTPNQGSFLLGGRAISASQRVFLSVINVWCQVDPRAQFIRDACRQLATMSNSAAGVAFAPGSDELRDLPRFPADLPVHAIATSVNEMSVSLFGHDLQLPGLGDLVVGTTSALDGAAHAERGGGSVTLSCEGVVFFLTPLPDCEHRNQMSSLEIAREVMLAIDKYRASDPASPQPGTDSPTASEQARILTGTWEGTYTCRQGLTGLRLDVRAEPAGSFSADFVFFAVSSNPGVPSGSYAMTGSLTASQVRLIQDHWVDQPAGYEMVDLAGNVPASGDRFRGQVTTSGCTTFDLQKTSSESHPPAPAPVPAPAPGPAPVPPVDETPGSAPEIVGTSTYVEGDLVYLSLLFQDVDGDADGFGFRGVNGSGWAEEAQTFASTSYGRFSPGRIDYPFNHGCGGSAPIETDIEAWISDASGQQSPPVVVHLACP